MNFYEFASNSPWLTFFLAMILGQVVIKVVLIIVTALAALKIRTTKE